MHNGALILTKSMSSSLAVMLGLSLILMDGCSMHFVPFSHGHFDLRTWIRLDKELENAKKNNFR